MAQSQSSATPYSLVQTQTLISENVVPLYLSQCLNPNCFTSNSGQATLCQSCGDELLLGGRYRAIHTIRSGGFSKTYQALDEHRLQTSCIIKQFLPDRLEHQTYLKATDLFSQEAVLLKDLGNHPQIPALKAFIQTEQHLFIVQDYIQGQTLLDVYNQKGRFTESQICEVLTELLPVLQFIHDRKVIHRDIKPSNIIRQPDGRLVLIDFGSSYQSYITLSQRRSPRTVTFGYAPPEQLRGESFPASDLYSLGLTCLRLYTGCFPEVDEPDPLLDLAQPIDKRHAALQFMHPSLVELFSKLLQPSPVQRYTSALNVLADLSCISQLVQSVEQPINGNLTSTPVQQGNHDLTRLRQLLAVHNYAEADRETWDLMLQISQCESVGSLNLVSLETLPLEPLQQIDALWQYYSEAHFGFSSQFRHFHNLCGDRGDRHIFDFEYWQTFTQDSGWCQDTTWLDYSELNFTELREAHLPAWCILPEARQGEPLGLKGWWRLGFITLYQRWITSQETGYPFLPEIASSQEPL